MPKETDKTFSLEYVQELRTENANWRTKLRDMEVKFADIETKMTTMNTTATIANEFAKRGIKADPSWIKLQEGQAITDAVDAFVVEYPQFGVVDTPPTTPATKPVIPPVHKKDQKSNVPSPGERTTKEIRDDPKAHAQVREQYRQMLSGKNNTL